VKLRFFCGCFAIVALVFGTSAAAGAPQGESTQRQPVGAAATYHGGLVTPPLPKPKFVLTDTSGAPFDFWVETQGYVTLLFFGYTHCPDVCPLQMANVASSLQRMSPEVSKHVKVVFVTTDPGRDSAAVLRTWLDHFDPRFVGLTGSEASILAAQRAARLPPASKTVSANRDYAMAHAAFVLAYTRDNLAHVIYPEGIAPGDFAHDLPLLVKETWASQ
jgi:protein SCO1